jgi:hypothetical protein
LATKGNYSFFSIQGKTFLPQCPGEKLTFPFIQEQTSLLLYIFRGILPFRCITMGQSSLLLLSGAILPSTVFRDNLPFHCILGNSSLLLYYILHCPKTKERKFNLGVLNLYEKHSIDLFNVKNAYSI